MDTLSAVSALVAVVFAAGGQILLKLGLGGSSMHAEPSLASLLHKVSSPTIIFGLLAYALSMVCWLFALQRTNLSVLYPFTALTYVLVMLASYSVLNESLSPVRIAGILLVLVGLLVAIRGN